ncbi:nucleoprotein TPR-like [Nilaparvata lugens]|uniref:nucleoprotein TPR-like n=1 Tax=Nilaparvata lugens TaxID=108931 RepID=UPI00193D2010|nr:nucleoprotein TPR-like [Nilaparvata lugens]XP_039277145.1 nucleoprotein TPR-like [Nilaparvata lugens]
MRLAVVFELLLILLIIAFAASNVIRDPSALNRARLLKKVEKNVKRTKQETSTSPTKYCNCSSSMCNCCRDFNIPVVSAKGPGCATISFLKDNEFGISMKYGDRVLRNITITGEKPQPVCMRLPGGVSKFCGRVYNIEKQGEQFKACLGLELRALENLEAALRVSCFRFGPGGLKVEAAEPFPPVVKQKGDKNEEEEEEDDDEYADDDDDDDDDDFGLSDDDDDDDDSEDAADNDVDSADYTGFSALSSEFLEGFFGSDSSKKKRKKPQVKEKPFSHSSMHSIMTHKQESMQSQPMQPVAQTMSQRPNKVKPTRVAPAVNPANPPVVATVPKVPAVKPTAAPLRNRVKVKVTVPSTTPTTTTERVTPSSIEPVVFIETTTPQPIIETTENTREEDGNMGMITSTMVSITSMQQLEEEEEDEEEEEEENEKIGGGGGGGLSTTTEMGTTEHTTETYTERDVSMSDRVDELKMENDKELLVSAAKIKDEDDEEEEEDDDDDDDVASVVDVTTLLDDDEDADHFGTNVDGKQPNKKKEEDILSGILDDDDDDEEEEEEESAKKKDQRTISLGEPVSFVRQEPETTVRVVEQPTTTAALQQTSTTREEEKVTRPPLAGMRLFVIDPKHPSNPKVENARSSRAHRRMRLPPLGMESQFS